MRCLLALAGCLVLIGHSADAGILDRVRETQTFKLGYRADAKPHSYRTEKGEPAGYAVDLCKEVAAAVIQSIGSAIKTEFVLIPVDQRFESVRDGKVDLLCDPSTITLARREMVDFSLPTFLDGASVLYRSNKPVQRYEDLAGKRVGVLGGTTTETTLRQSLEGLRINANVTVVRDHRSGMDMLTGDRIDAYFADRSIIAALLYEGGRPGFTLGRNYFSYEMHALALPRGEDEFRLLIDRTLSRIYRTGRIDDILARTFGAASTDEMLKTMFVINSLPDR
jgi:polar amino acid transport system substrate-binding protein/glutamate/aspartate transport system substrate-binding protein